MFKRKYVKISSERVIEKIENFFKNNGLYGDLTPQELYAFRYDFDGSELNINDPSIIQKISINDIFYWLKKSSSIIHHEKGSLFMGSISLILDIFKSLNERLIFVIKEEDSTISKIMVYIPSITETNLFIGDFENVISNVNGISEFIRDGNSIFKSCIQDGSIKKPEELVIDKEFFIITNLKIENSTITLHYVP